AGALGWSGGFLNARWLFVFLRLGLSGGGSGGLVTRGFLRSSGLLRRVARREVPAASAKQCECQNSDGGDEDGRLLRRFLGLFGGPGAAWAPGRRRGNAGGITGILIGGSGWLIPLVAVSPLVLWVHRRPPWHPRMRYRITCFISCLRRRRYISARCSNREMGFCSPLAKFKSQTLQLNVPRSHEGQAVRSAFALLNPDILAALTIRSGQGARVLSQTTTPPRRGSEGGPCLPRAKTSVSSTPQNASALIIG